MSRVHNHDIRTAAKKYYKISQNIVHIPGDFLPSDAPRLPPHPSLLWINSETRYALIDFAEKSEFFSFVNIHINLLYGVLSSLSIVFFFERGTAIELS